MTLSDAKRNSAWVASYLDFEFANLQKQHEACLRPGGIRIVPFDGSQEILFKVASCFYTGELTCSAEDVHARGRPGDRRCDIVER